MSQQETLDCVSITKRLLVESSSSANEFLDQLHHLSSIVSQSSQDPDFRQEISSQPELIELVVDIITESFNIDIESETIRSLYIRLFRGALMLTRNIVVIKPDAIDLPLFLLSIQHFSQKTTKDDPFYLKTLEVYIQTLANMTQTLSTGGEHLLDLIRTSFDAFLIRIMNEHENLKLPFLFFLNNVFSLQEVVYDFLTFEKFDYLCEFLLQESEKYILNDEGQTTHTLLSLISKVVSHESYNKWISQRVASKDMVQIVKINQLVITSVESWDNYQLTAILSWVWDCFKVFSASSSEMLRSSEWDETGLNFNHANTIGLLDIISDLCKFNATKGFLNHYNGLEELIDLLRVVHENVERKTLKKGSEPKSVNAVNSKKLFPQVKSLIIEILAYLTHDSVETQDKIRDLHGLELVLSNCMIDDNDPFIKERSIVCLKFLLAGNQANQKFVADLEAKKTYDDQALKEVGYEVEIKEGQVQLKQLEDLKNLQDKISSKKNAF